MGPVPAIVRQTLRAAVREKVVLCLLLTLLVVLVALPLGLKGDGTAEGEVRILIRYSLGLALALLSLATLWASCGTVSGDIASRRLHLVLAKPVSRFQVWFGKWLGLVLLNGLLLAGCGVVVTVLLHFRIERTVTTPGARERLEAELITARTRIHASGMDVEAEARRLLEREKANQRMPSHLSEEAFLDELRKVARTLFYSVGTEDSRGQWTFTLRRPVTQDEDIQLAYRYQPNMLSMQHQPGIWTVGTPEQPALYRVEVNDYPTRSFVLHVNQDGQLAGARELTVRYERGTDDREMVFFEPETGLVIYRPAGGFGMNLFRALLLLWGLLALLAALGVTAGAVFTMPVAVYVVFAVLVMQRASGAMSRAMDEGLDPHMAVQESASGLSHALQKASEILYHGVDLVLTPVRIGNPLEEVAQGVAVSWTWVGTVLFLRLFPVLLLLALAGTLMFRRREVAV